MKGPGSRFSAICLALTVACQVLGEDAAHDDPGEDDQPPPQQILRDVVDRLPLDRLIINGDITVRKRRGSVLNKLLFDALLDLGGSPPLTRYTLQDAFGSELEQLTMVHHPNGAPDLIYTAGHPPVTADAPGLADAVQGTDIRWMDLNLSFLWWPSPTLVGAEEVRGRPCYVIDVTNPGIAGADSPQPENRQASSCTRARLWIDRKLRMLLQAEMFDEDSKPMRRLWVKSLKKIDKRWMIKEMEVQGTSAVRRTRLTVKDVSYPGPLL